MRAVVSTRGGVEVEGGHHTVESRPREVVTGRLVFWVEVESSHTPPFGISPIAELIATQIDRNVTIAVLVHGVGLLRHRRGRFGKDQNRRDKG
jgi:hypothetical protein